MWQQSYDPMGAWAISTLVSALPVVTLFFVLLVMRKPIWLASLVGFVVAIVLAAVVFQMPAVLIAMSAFNGVVFGFLRIAWLIIGSLFLFRVAEQTGQFQIMKESIAGLSSDRRMQVILVAFCFGAFLEGTGGGGAPVAIAGSFLIGLGVPPFEAAVMCLLANTAPVAWGGVGNPITTLQGVTGLDVQHLNAMVGRILPPFSLILPAWLIVTMCGWRRASQVWPALLVSGGSFAAMQFYWANYQNHTLVDILSAIFSLLSTVVFLKVWRPKPDTTAESARSIEIKQHSLLTIIRGWAPFILTSLFIFVWTQPAWNKRLALPALTMDTPVLANQVIRMPPVVAKPTPESAKLDLNLLALPGTAVILGAIASALLSGMKPARIGRLFVETCGQLVPSMLAISCMVGLAYVTKYSGMDTVLGLSLTRTGWAYPFFGTLLGWLGVALTGTDAGSNALFGNLQKVTAEQVGVSPVLMASANSAGGVMGKMIDAQSILVASTACDLHGREADVFKAVIWHSLALACLVAILVTLYAYVFPQVIPG